MTKVQKDIKSFLQKSNTTLKKYIGANLGTDSSKIAINLAKQIITNEKNFNIDLLFISDLYSQNDNINKNYSVVSHLLLDGKSKTQDSIFL